MILEDDVMSISRRGLPMSTPPPWEARQPRVHASRPIAAGKTLKDPNGRVVLGYLTSKPAGVPLEGNSACCIHPFNTLGGERATDIAPPTIATTAGIFFAWHDMTFSAEGRDAARRLLGMGTVRADRGTRDREPRSFASCARTRRRPRSPYATTG